MTARDIVMSAAGNAGDGKTYIEDVFSTYLYTGNGSTQTINNGIDLAGKGGLIWTKCRDTAYSNALVDTVRGTPYVLCSDRTDSQFNYPDISSFNSNGYTIGQNYSSWFNASSKTYASWTFRKAPKFFDVVTYTGNGASTQTISHSLGSIPGMIIAKGISGATDWPVYHRSLNGGTNPEQYYLRLNAASAQSNAVPNWGNTAPTASTFTVGSNNNVNGYTYVAYLFAHDTTTDGLIQCGGYTGSGSATGPIINLGWEPQYVLIKRTDGYGDWVILDVMRGMPVGSASKDLLADSTAIEGAFSPSVSLTATGFQLTSNTGYTNTINGTFVYMAIRRGPMKTPTDGTKVFKPVAYTGDDTSNRQITSGFVADLTIRSSRTMGFKHYWSDRLRGGKLSINSNTTDPESIEYVAFDVMDGIKYTVTGAGYNDSSYNYINNLFRRAPGFFDVVCYTGTGDSQSVLHGLGVSPELMIVKRRDNTSSWFTYNATSGVGKYLMVNDTAAVTTLSQFMSSVTATSFVPTTNNSFIGLSNTGATYVAYLFASCPGVSKVGSYTGNGSSQTINCGFAAGARFVLIKRTDNTGDWYVWDTARGIVTGNDPHLSLNTAAAEVTSDDTIDPEATGFIVNQVAATNVNVSGASYIYLAIA